jgi:hypothetical protein
LVRPPGPPGSRSRPSHDYWFEGSPEELLRFKVVRQAIGMEDARNFRRNVRRHSDFIEAIANHGIVEAPTVGSGGSGFLKPNFVEALSVE